MKRHHWRRRHPPRVVVVSPTLRIVSHKGRDVRERRADRVELEQRTEALRSERHRLSEDESTLNVLG